MPPPLAHPHPPVFTDTDCAAFFFLRIISNAIPSCAKWILIDRESPGKILVLQLLLQRHYSGFCMLPVCWCHTVHQYFCGQMFLQFSVFGNCLILNFACTLCTLPDLILVFLILFFLAWCKINNNKTLQKLPVAFGTKYEGYYHRCVLL